MCNDIFNQEITCKSGNYGIPSIHCYLNKSELWLKIEENIEVYNKFGFKQINLSTLRSAKLLDKNYCCDIKTWIPFNVNSIILFVFDAKDIYENN
ncbi:Hypothetical protein SRAE_X000234200 [Strongyloides ratti]|uniref:Uncharacterized protein n=1 Tax=Strongyloides ratti TaxID=34506 RepID=A0A090KXK2_STRRB|nr:Hypothetical protein SRAE_X000234200 [Strongyloides ratti]CEF60607.1 Hypothetical protein SRAE_X000234200 [Strongyloides ratti]